MMNKDVKQGMLNVSYRGESCDIIRNCKNAEGKKRNVQIVLKRRKTMLTHNMVIRSG